MRRLLILGLVALAAGALWSLRPASEAAPEAPREPGAMEPTDWFFLQRAYPYGTVRPEAFRLAHAQAEALRSEAAARGGAPWEFAGPTNIGGRVTALAVVDASTYYVGTATGGVFQTTDAGASFVPLGDDVMDLSIGDVALAPSAPQTLYVGTGEANGGGGSLTYGGRGVYRSDDGGQTWQARGLEATGTIGRVVVHPTDPNTVWVAAAGLLFANDPNRGLYRTTDGGQTWDKTLFVNDSTGAVDVAVNPRSPDTLYAATWERVRRPDRRSYGGLGSGLYRSADGGQTWTEMTNGLPTDANVGRIGVAVSASRPNVVYAVYTDAIGNVRNVYRSDDGGTSWTARAPNPGPSFGWWFGQIRVDPTDEDVVYTPWLNLYKSTNGGLNWTFASGIMHVDQHALWIDPSDPNRLIAGNDGGVYASSNGATTWVKATGPFPITQFYTVEIDESVPARLYGGTQDNGTNRTLTGALDDWQNIYGGDGFVVLVEPTNNQFMYAESQYGGLGRSVNGGTSFIPARSGIPAGERNNWNSPLAFSPQDPTTLYFGTQRVYRSTNRAQLWTALSPDLSDGPGGNLVYGTTTTIGPSPADADVIWAGTDDGNVWVTTDGGTNWTDVSAGLPDRWVTRVTPHPTLAGTAYVTLSGYRWNEPLAHVFRTDDFGATWEDRSSGLPEVPVNDLDYDPQNPDYLFLATDAGVFFSEDAGASWRVLGVGLPAAPVLDLDLHDGTRSLVASTFGRSMYRFDLDMVPVASEPGPVAERLTLTAAPNPFREAVTLRYTLARPGAVTLAVYDARGRRVAVVDEGRRTAGTHTARWEARLPAGTYTVRLLTDGHQASTRITRIR